MGPWMGQEYTAERVVILGDRGAEIWWDGSMNPYGRGSAILASEFLRSFTTGSGIRFDRKFYSTSCRSKHPANEVHCNHNRT